MIDRQFTGRTFPGSVLEIEAGRLKFFAKAIGETNPIYLDEAAAKAAGYQALPAPPTFLFSVEMDAGALVQALVEMGVRLNRVLHGEQSFTYHAPVHAGDTITVETRIGDIYDKRNGALDFIEFLSEATNQRKERVAEIRNVIVVRN